VIGVMCKVVKRRARRRSTNVSNIDEEEQCGSEIESTFYNVAIAGRSCKKARTIKGTTVSTAFYKYKGACRGRCSNLTLDSSK
jgi:hypothetical protein